MENHLKQKGKFDYLPWAVAIKQLTMVCPKASWKFLPHTIYPDGSVMVEVSVTIEDVTKHYILPVYSSFGGKPKAIINPDSYAINTAYQRCLVKTIASFGLGLDIFTQDETDEMYVDVEEQNDVAEKTNKPAKEDNFFSAADVPLNDAVKEFVRQMKGYIKTCETEKELTELWLANKKYLSKLDYLTETLKVNEENVNSYNMLVSLCKEVKSEIKQGETKNV